MFNISARWHGNRLDTNAWLIVFLVNGFLATCSWARRRVTAGGKNTVNVSPINRLFLPNTMCVDGACLRRRLQLDCTRTTILHSVGTGHLVFILVCHECNSLAGIYFRIYIVYLFIFDFIYEIDIFMTMIWLPMSLYMI